ncbi:phytanoyl-CoA dioxygenase family protein [Kineococcus esterisolvens]|uniref:hypothetical protein n=1 Tax=unclassified Kineococcus TaxID=2621656 RepID=UPI003D7C6B94
MKTSAHIGGRAGRGTGRWSRERTVVLPEAGRVVAELRRDGIATTSVAALTGDSGVLDEVVDCAHALVERRARDVCAQRRLLQAGGDPWARPPDADRVPLLGDDAPATSCRLLLLHPVLGGVAEAYCGRAVRSVEPTGWLEVATGSPVPPRRWERAPRGRRPVLEVWISLTADEDGDGPLHYVRGTHRRQRGEGAVPRAFEATGGPAGTVVFADPCGMHRRSPAVERDRVLLHGAFSTVRRPPRPPRHAVTGARVPRARRALHDAFALAGA